MAKVVTKMIPEERYYKEPEVAIIGKYCFDVPLKTVWGLIEQIRGMHPNETLLTLVIRYEKRKNGLELEYDLADDDCEQAYTCYYTWRNEAIRIRRNCTLYFLDSLGQPMTDERISELTEQWYKAFDEHRKRLKDENSRTRKFKAQIDFEWRKSKKGE